MLRDMRQVRKKPRKETRYWNLQCRTVFDASLSAQCISSIGQIIQVANYSRENARRGDYKGWVTLRLNFWLKGYVSRQYLWAIRWGDGYTTTLPLEVFTHKTFAQTLLDWNWILFKKTKNRFEPPFGGLRGDVRTPVRWKARGRLPICHN